jgi:hypothetical protein
VLSRTVPGLRSGTAASVGQFRAKKEREVSITTHPERSFSVLAEDSIQPRINKGT